VGRSSPHHTIEPERQRWPSCESTVAIRAIPCRTICLVRGAYLLKVVAVWSHEHAFDYSSVRRRWPGPCPWQASRSLEGSVRSLEAPRIAR
jgi:hypothetical protein